MDRAVRVGAAQCVSWGILFYGFGLILPAMSGDLAGSPVALSGAFSAALAVTAVVSLRVGRWIDEGHERAVFLGGIGLGTISLLAWAASRSVAHLYLAMIGIGAAMALTQYEPAFALINRWYRSTTEKNRALIIVTLLGALAGPIFVPALGFAVTAWGWRAAVIGGAGALLATSLIYLGILEPGGPARNGGAPAGRFPRTLWWLGAAAFLSSFGGTTIAVHLPTYLVGRGESLAVPAGVIAAMGLAQFPARLLIAPVATRWGATRVLATALAMQAVAVAVIATFRSAVALVLAGAAFGAGNGAATILRAVGAREQTGDVGYGTAVGRLGAFAVAARAAAPLSAGILAAALAPSAPFVVSAGLLLAWSVAGFRIGGPPGLDQSSQASSQ